MIEKICDILINRAKEKMPDIDEERAEIIRYGFELIIGEIPKIFLIFVIAALSNRFKYFLISFAIICPYRVFSGGIHLKTHIGCLITTALLYLGTVFIAEIFRFDSEYLKIAIILLVYVFSIIMIVLYAPADTATVPILRKSDRLRGKIKSIIWISIILFLAIIIKKSTISNICILGVLFQTLTIMKISYKVFNVKLGYLEYEKSL